MVTLVIVELVFRWLFRPFGLLALHIAVFITPANLGRRRKAAQERIYDIYNRAADGDFVALDHLDNHIKSRRRFAL
jgi:hypothetical protein